MTTLASTLLDFILGLLRDEEAAKAFDEDPEAALAAAGFPDVDPATVHALMPVMADSSPAAYARPHAGRDDDDKGHGGHHDPKPVRDEDCDKDDGHWHEVWHDDDCDDDVVKDHGGHDRDHGGHKGQDYAGHGQEAAVIHNVRYVENNYSHTDVDVDIENAIWAGAGSQVVTGDDNVVAGGGSVAAGDDIEDSTIHTGDSDDDTLNVNSGNTINSGNVIGNEDNDTTNTNSGNTTTTNNGSYNQDNDGSEVNQIGLVNTVGDGNFDASDDDGIDQDGLVNVVDNDGVDQDGLVNANGDGNFDASDDDGQDVDQHGLVNGNAGGDLDASDDDGKDIDQHGLINVGDDVDASDDDVLSNNDVLSHNDVLSNNEDNDVNDQDGSGNVFDPDLIDVDVPVTVEAEPAA